MQAIDAVELLRRLRCELEAIDDDREGGVSAARGRALIVLADRPGATVSELATALLVDPSTASRVVGELEGEGWSRVAVDREDRRRRLVSLTARGRRVAERLRDEQRVRLAGALGPADVDAAARLAGALERARRRRELVVRPIEAGDDPGVAALIRTVMPSFGADGPGFAIHDAEVDAMSRAYRGRRAGYWVVERGGSVVGGAGFAALVGGDDEVCELRKMYFLPEVRGLGIGRELLMSILEAARTAGFRRCYVETLTSMTAAQGLYRRAGFEPCGRAGATGHGGCDTFYMREL